MRMRFRVWMRVRFRVRMRLRFGRFWVAFGRLRFGRAAQTCGRATVKAAETMARAVSVSDSRGPTSGDLFLKIKIKLLCKF